MLLLTWLQGDSQSGSSQLKYIPPETALCVPRNPGAKHLEIKNQAYGHVAIN